MISLKNIECIYHSANSKVHALIDVNLEIGTGEIFGVIGRSGAGKSTLIRCINLLERPSKGTVTVDKRNLSLMDDKELRLARRQIGMIFQNFNLLSSRTVYDNIALPLELVGASKREIDLTVQPLLELTGLVDKMEVFPHELSGGQKQRVGIARALVHRPKVLLCDEATSSLDPKTTHSILNLLKDINSSLNLTILLITHEMEVVKTICERVAVLHHGEIIEQASMLELFTEPKSDVAKDFIKTTTRLEMPAILRRQLKPAYVDPSNYILRLSFNGQSNQDSVIALVIKNHKLHINIIQAHLESIHGQSIGIMIIEVQGLHSNILQGIEFVKNKGLHVEVLGYVSRTT